MGVLLGLMLNGAAQSFIHADIWQNTMGSSTVNNYPVWIKLGAPLNYTISGYTDNSGHFSDSLPTITVPTQATFITYTCTGSRVFSQQTLSPNLTNYGDTLIVGCDSLPPYLTAEPVYLLMGGNPAGFSFFGNHSDTSLPSGTRFQYSWAFGDGNFSNSRTSSHIYSTSGTFNACFTVMAIDSVMGITIFTSDSCLTVSPVVSGANCRADFTPSSTGSGTFSFQDSSTVSTVPAGGSVSYGWDFGDGNGDTTQSATHTYSAAGNYNVCHWVVVRNAQSAVVCTDTVCKSVNYSINPSGCAADFSVSTSTGSLTVNFTNTSLIPAIGNVNYQWFYGDGNTSSQQSPVYSYSSPGNYSACLVISVLDSNNSIICSDSICKNVQVGLGSCQAGISLVHNPSVPAGYGVNNIPNPSAALVYDSSFVVYDFGNGYTATHSPAIGSSHYNYSTSGTYQICLTNFYLYRADTVCFSSACSTVVVSLNKFCKADYIVDTVNSYQGNVFIWNTSTPSNTSALHANSYQWDFGDGNTSNQPFPLHTYANPGMYAVCLSLTSVDSANNMCTDTYCDTLGVDSLGNLIYKNSGGFTLNVLDPNAIGLEEKLVQEFSIYPNPAEDRVTLAWDELVSGELNWQITDLKGAILMKGTQNQTNKKEVQLDVSRLKAGVYILSASHKNSPAAHHKLKIH